MAWGFAANCTRVGSSRVGVADLARSCGSAHTPCPAGGGCRPSVCLSVCRSVGPSGPLSVCLSSVCRDLVLRAAGVCWRRGVGEVSRCHPEAPWARVV
eukprot:3247884-Pyramimonas_sp.AAC.1